MTPEEARALIDRLAEGRLVSTYVTDALAAMADVVGDLGAKDIPACAAILDRARGNIDEGRRMKFHDHDFITKVLPDIVLAFALSGVGRRDYAGRLRHMLWEQQIDHALTEFSYIIEIELWDRMMSGD